MTVPGIVMLVIDVRLVQVCDAPFSRFGAEDAGNLILFCFGEDGVKDENRLDNAVRIGR